jgi:hypothetical protein
MEFAATRGVPGAETCVACVHDDRDRTLWLELAEEIASRDPAWSKAISAVPN